MKSLINQLGFAALALLACVVTAVPSASASDFCPAKYSDPKYVRFECNDIVSTTTVANFGEVSVSPKRDLTISLRGVGVAASATLILKAGGTIVDYQTVAVPNGSANVVKFTGPLYFDSFVVSATTALASGAIDVNAVSPKK